MILHSAKNKKQLQLNQSYFFWFNQLFDIVCAWFDVFVCYVLWTFQAFKEKHYIPRNQYISIQCLVMSLRRFTIRLVHLGVHGPVCRLVRQVVRQSSWGAARSGLVGWSVNGPGSGVDSRRGVGGQAVGWWVPAWCVEPRVNSACIIVWCVGSCIYCSVSCCLAALNLFCCQKSQMTNNSCKCSCSLLARISPTNSSM